MTTYIQNYDDTTVAPPEDQVADVIHDWEAHLIDRVTADIDEVCEALSIAPDVRDACVQAVIKTRAAARARDSHSGVKFRINFILSKERYAEVYRAIGQSFQASYREVDFNIRVGAEERVEFSRLDGYNLDSMLVDVNRFNDDKTIEVLKGEHQFSTLLKEFFKLECAAPESPGWFDSSLIGALSHSYWRSSTLQIKLDRKEDGTLDPDSDNVKLIVARRATQEGMDECLNAVHVFEERIVSPSFVWERFGPLVIETLNAEGFTQVEPADPNLDEGWLNHALLAMVNGSTIDQMGIIATVLRNPVTDARIAIEVKPHNISLHHGKSNAAGWRYLDTGRVCLSLNSYYNLIRDSTFPTLYEILTTARLSPIPVDDSQLRLLINDVDEWLMVNFEAYTQHVAQRAQFVVPNDEDEDEEDDWEEEEDEEEDEPVKQKRVGKVDSSNAKFIGGKTKVTVITANTRIHELSAKFNRALNSGIPIEFEHWTLHPDGYEIAGRRVAIESKLWISRIRSRIGYGNFIGDLGNVERLDRNGNNEDMTVAQDTMLMIWVGDDTCTFRIDDITLAKEIKGKSGIRVNGKRIAKADMRTLLSDIYCMVGRRSTQEEVDGYIAEISRLGYPLREALGMGLYIKFYNDSGGNGAIDLVKCYDEWLASDFKVLPSLEGSIIIPLERVKRTNMIVLGSAKRKVSDLRGLIAAIRSGRAFSKSEVLRLMKKHAGVTLGEYVKSFRVFENAIEESITRSMMLFRDVLVSTGSTYEGGHVFVGSAESGNRYKINVNDNTVSHMPNGGTWSKVCIIQNGNTDAVGFDHVISRILSVANDTLMGAVIHTLPITKKQASLADPDEELEDDPEEEEDDSWVEDLEQEIEEDEEDEDEEDEEEVDDPEETIAYMA